MKIKITESQYTRLLKEENKEDYLTELSDKYKQKAIDKFSKQTYESEDRIINTIKKFEQFKDAFKGKDLMSYSYDELKKAVRDAGADSAAKKAAREYKKKEYFSRDNRDEIDKLRWDVPHNDEYNKKIKYGNK